MQLKPTSSSSFAASSDDVNGCTPSSAKPRYRRLHRAASSASPCGLADRASAYSEAGATPWRPWARLVSQQARSFFPFPLLGVDFDNDSAFMNEFVVSWCRSEELEVTRSRAYRKNDQAHVEQKNGAIVRRLVGYGRFVGAEATAALGQLYAVVRLYGNLFQSSFKLLEKTRIGC